MALQLIATARQPPHITLAGTLFREKGSVRATVATQAQKIARNQIAAEKYKRLSAIRIVAENSNMIRAPESSTATEMSEKRAGPHKSQIVRSIR